MTPDTHVLLGRRYQLTARIAAGGMGEVWAATDEVLGRDVAVKILRREYATDPTFLARFRAEARHTAALSHAGIAAIFDYSDGAPRGPDDEGDAPYLVMELINGQPLSAVIAREGAMSAPRVFDIVGQAAHALQNAHDVGVIHRDVKPGNILLTAAGTVKITDFGISRATNSAPLTQTGTIMGTAYYISPEQASGRSVTPASDIYSLGVVAYECLSGRRPFAGDTPVSVALAQVRDEPPALGPDVSPEARDLVMRMLAKDPARRPASAGALAEEARFLSLAAEAAAGTRGPPTAAGPDATQALDLPVTPSGPGREAASGPEAATLGRTDADTDPGFRLPAPGGTSRWVPYAVALTVLGLLLLGLARACSQDATTTSTTSGPGQQGASRGSAAPSEAVLVRASEYLGQPVARARAALRDLGLQVVLRPVTTNRSSAVGTVTGVDPTGRLSPDTSVTLEYAQASAGDGRGKKAKRHGKNDERGRQTGNGQNQEEDDE